MENFLDMAGCRLDYPSKGSLKDIVSARDTETMRVLAKPMQKYLENVIFGTKIRKVIAIVEKRDVGGYCDTCSYDDYSVRVYFKSIDGRLCLYTAYEKLQDLIGYLIQANSRFKDE